MYHGKKRRIVLLSALALMFSVFLSLTCISFAYAADGNISSGGLKDVEGNDIVFDKNGVSGQKVAGADQFYGLPSAAFSVSTGENGSTFVMAPPSWMIVGGELDVTKAIKIDFQMDPDKAWTNGTAGNFSFALYDSFDEIIANGQDCWREDGDAALGEKRGGRVVIRGGLKEDLVYRKKLLIGDQLSQEYDYQANMASLVIKIGEETSGSFAMLNGTKICNLNVKKSDFSNGTCALVYSLGNNVSPFETVLKISQFEINVRIPDKDGNEMLFDSNGISAQILKDVDEENYGVDSTGVKNEGEYTSFVMEPDHFMWVGGELDVNKLINISYKMNLADSSAANGVFAFTLFDSLDNLKNVAHNAYADAETNSGKVIIRGGNNPEYQFCNKIKVGDNLSGECDYVNDMVQLTISVGEAKADSYILINGEKFANLDICRADFADGLAYLSFCTSQSGASYESGMAIRQFTNIVTLNVDSDTEGFKPVSYIREQGTVIEEPAAQSIDGYTFAGYFEDRACVIPFDFAAPVVLDTTIYAKYMLNDANKLTITFKCNLYDDVTVEVYEGYVFAEAPGNVFENKGWSAEWLQDGVPFDFSIPIVNDEVLTARWVEAEIELYHKSHGVIDTDYKWEYAQDAHGWDMEYTNPGEDVFIDKKGNTVIDSNYGRFLPDGNYSTYEDHSSFLMNPVRAITNLTRLDITKEIRISYKVNNWDTLDREKEMTNKPELGEGESYSSYYPANAQIKFRLFDNVLSALKAGVSNTGAKVELITSSIDTSNLFGKFHDTLSDVISEKVSDSANFIEDRQKIYTISIYISEDGTQNVLKINDHVVEGALAGLKQSDFLGGYAYLQIGNEGATHQYWVWLSQQYRLSFETVGNGIFTSNVENESVYSNTEVIIQLNPGDGYSAKGVRVGDEFYYADSMNQVKFYKKAADEVAIVEFGKSCTLTFETNGAGEISSQTVSEGSTFTPPANPKKDGYKFAGWYTDADCTQRFSFNTEATDNIVLYAKWEKIEEGNTGCGCSGNIGGNIATFGCCVGFLLIAVLKKKAAAK